MQNFEVEVQTDHLQRLFSSLSPLTALSELIWNALDADADCVQVNVSRNALAGDESITVEDDGHGMDHDDAVAAFKNLGGSRKAGRGLTPKGRYQHGKLGKGRFRAFALGGAVEWRTRYQLDGQVLGYAIDSSRANPRQFRVSDPSPVATGTTGTTVVITDPLKPSLSLETPEVRQKLTEEFALYLRQYPGVSITVCGNVLDPSAMQARSSEYQVGPVDISGNRPVEGFLTVIEWIHAPERALFLCDEHGSTLSKTSPGVQAPGYSFTAYLRSAYLGELHQAGNLMLDDLHPDLKAVLDAAKACLREHFRARSAEDARGAVEQWKKDEVYPFAGEAQGPIEEAKRQVFDVVALNVEAAMPKGDELDPKQRRFAFRLLREAIERSPQSLQTILDEVLGLPHDKREELAELLRQTTLENIIGATRIVGDRLDFLQGLETLVFDPESKKALLERRQLHRIVAGETWIFGEQYALAVSDRGLTEVLRKHLGNEDKHILDDTPVLLPDGGTGIVDLMLSRLLPQTNPQEREHLVIELKRPSVRLDSAALTQVEKYAAAIASDERFRGTEAKWSFWVISNDYDDLVRSRCSQRGMPKGLVLEPDGGAYRIWVKTWGQLLEECRGRMHFFKEKLAYNATLESGLEYLRKAHAKYLPRMLASAAADVSPQGKA